MARAIAAASFTFVSIFLPSGPAAAQAPRKPMPTGARIVAHDRDTIVLDDDARVRLVREREANARVIFDACERWAVFLANFDTDGGPDGRADWTYYFRDMTGKWPLDARVLHSILLLDEAAIEAARQWRYAPTLLNGQAVPVSLTVPVTFQ